MLRKGLGRDLLIFLAFLVDELDAYSYKNQLRRLFCQGWYKQSSFGPTISRLLSVGDIEKIQKRGKVFYRLTSRGSQKVKQNIPILKLAQKPWDGKWRLVIFDIQEKNKFLREALRNKLLSLGFGMWQKSVYITPFNIQEEVNEYLITQRLFPQAVCLVARRADLGNDKELARKIWKLDKLNEEYRDFIEDCQKVQQKIKEQKVEEKEIQNLWLAWKDLHFKDPHLPKELLFQGWLDDKARKEFIKFFHRF